MKLHFFKSNKEEKKAAQNTQEQDIFWREEVEANILSSIVAISLSVIWGVYYSTVISGLTVGLRNEIMTLVAGVCLAILGLVGVVGIVTKGRYPWVKYMLMITILFTVCVSRALRSYYGILLCIIPIVLSVRYLSKKVTVIITALTEFMVAVAQLLSTEIGILDLNMVELTPGQVLVIPEGKSNLLKEAVYAAGHLKHLYLQNTIIYMVGLNFVEILLVGAICARVVEFARATVLRHVEDAENEATLKSELTLAANIQSSIMPQEFPAFPERGEFELIASMNPAKEVGGDFYDFFLIDDDHLVLVMADVSGKGVPASLFMMTSKVTIKNRAMRGGTPAEILADANEQLFEGNKTAMFVTVWLGILTISTGHMIEANAGHESPVICKKGGQFALSKNRHGFVLGGMSGVKYKNWEYDLGKGDVLFIYTDGVPEATNEEKRLFGKERMVDSLNKARNLPVQGVLDVVKADIVEFVGNAPQFDDFTMLAIKYQGR